MTARPSKTPDQLTPADVQVLAILAARPTHGYELVLELSRRDSAEVPAVSRAQVYYSLKKLLKLKLIAAVQDGTPSAGPEREPYRLTAAGRREMSRAIARPEWARGRLSMPFQVWLMVLGEADKDHRAAAIRLRKAYLAESIDQQLRAIERLRIKPDSNTPIDSAVASHALEVLRLELQLLTDVEPMLGQEPVP